MFVSKNSRNYRRRIAAADEVEVNEAPVEVAEEASDLLFEAEDVAELLAEVTEDVVEVNVDGDDVVFSVGEDEFTVSPEGDEEILESSRRNFRGKKPVRANRKPARRAPVKASASRRPVRKVRK